jgi:hypothetical protein
VLDRLAGSLSEGSSSPSAATRASFSAAERARRLSEDLAAQRGADGADPHVGAGGQAASGPVSEPVDVCATRVRLGRGVCPYAVAASEASTGSGVVPSGGDKGMLPGHANTGVIAMETPLPCAAVRVCGRGRRR